MHKKVEVRLKGHAKVERSNLVQGEFSNVTRQGRGGICVVMRAGQDALSSAPCLPVAANRG
jgi:hypothetical protein